MHVFLRLKPLHPGSLRPWRRGLIATTGLTLLLFGAIQLWNSGWAEWAFVVSFVTIWLLVSVLWSNDDYIEESTVVLADIMDQNFEALHERLKKIEQEIHKDPNPRNEKPHRAA
jgi:hypothetical protein